MTAAYRTWNACRLRQSGLNSRPFYGQVRWRRVVADGAHMLVRPKTARTEALLKLSANARWCLVDRDCMPSVQSSSSHMRVSEGGGRHVLLLQLWILPSPITRARSVVTQPCVAVRRRRQRGKGNCPFCLQLMLILTPRCACIGSAVTCACASDGKCIVFFWACRVARVEHSRDHVAPCNNCAHVCFRQPSTTSPGVA